ncbi:hypothetical protein CsatB_014373 [Cannabis sativa]
MAAISFNTPNFPSGFAFPETAKLIPEHMLTFKIVGEPEGPYYAHYGVVGSHLEFDFKEKKTLEERKMATVGGIKEVDGNQNSLEIESLARFAVDEHNKKQNSLLQFEKVVNTKVQVVSGTMHHITLEALDGDKKKVYEAKVWEKPWMHFKELQEFKYIGDAPSGSSS